MSQSESLANLEKLADIASLAGLKSQVNQEHMRLEVVFGFPEGRAQAVYVEMTAENTSGSMVVTVSSPCHVIKKGLLSGLSKQTAIELLKLNEKTIFARYGIRSFDNGDVVMASVDHILETFDPEEFRNSAYHVALAADSFEKQHGGKDEF